MARYTLIVAPATGRAGVLRPFVALMRLVSRLKPWTSACARTEATREQILKYSPAGKVPVLKIEEHGQAWAVWDSLAIAKPWPSAIRKPTWPAEPAARAMRASYACEMHSGFC